MAVSSLSRGLARIGVLLSIVWIVIVAGTAAHEAQDKQEICAMTPDLGHCRHFFYTWQSDNERTEREDDSARDDRKRPERLLLNLGKVMLKVESGRPPVYRLDAQNLLLAIFAPLLALWGLGVGIVWCADGFRAKK